MPTKSPSKITEAQAIQAGVSEAFTDWLEWHSATAPEAVTFGVQTAAGKWLDDNEYRIEQMLKEEISNIARETVACLPFGLEARVILRPPPPPQPQPGWAQTPPNRNPYQTYR